MHFMTYKERLRGDFVGIPTPELLKSFAEHANESPSVKFFDGKHYSPTGRMLSKHFLVPNDVLLGLTVQQVRQEISKRAYHRLYALVILEITGQIVTNLFTQGEWKTRKPYQGGWPKYNFWEDAGQGFSRLMHADYVPWKLPEKMNKIVVVHNSQAYVSEKSREELRKSSALETNMPFLGEHISAETMNG